MAAIDDSELIRISDFSDQASLRFLSSGCSRLVQPTSAPSAKLDSVNSMEAKLVEIQKTLSQICNQLGIHPIEAETSRQTLPVPYSDPYIRDDHNRFTLDNSESLMPEFDGSNVSDWLSKVEQFFSMGRYSDLTKLDLVAFSLEGDVLLWFDREMTRREFHSWDEFRRRLLLKFGVPPEKSSENVAEILEEKASYTETKLIPQCQVPISSLEPSLSFSSESLDVSQAWQSEIVSNNRVHSQAGVGCVKNKTNAHHVFDELFRMLHDPGGKKVEHSDDIFETEVVIDKVQRTQRDTVVEACDAEIDVLDGTATWIVTSQPANNIEEAPGNRLLAIQQKETVFAYVTAFEELSTQIIALEDSHLEQVFNAGLKTEIQELLKLTAPVGLENQKKSRCLKASLFNFKQKHKRIKRSHNQQQQHQLKRKFTKSWSFKYKGIEEAVDITQVTLLLQLILDDLKSHMRHKWKSKNRRAVFDLQNSPAYALDVVNKTRKPWGNQQTFTSKPVASVHSLSFEVGTEETMSSGLSQNRQVWEPGGVLSDHVLVDNVEAGSKGLAYDGCVILGMNCAGFGRGKTELLATGQQMQRTDLFSELLKDSSNGGAESFPILNVVTEHSFLWLQNTSENYLIVSEFEKKKQMLGYKTRMFKYKSRFQEISLTDTQFLCEKVQGVLCLSLAAQFNSLEIIQAVLEQIIQGETSTKIIDNAASSSGSHAKSLLIEMGFCPTLVQKAIGENGEDLVELLLEILTKSTVTEEPSFHGLMEPNSEPDIESETDSRRMTLLTMQFPENLVDLALDRLGKDTPNWERLSIWHRWRRKDCTRTSSCVLPLQFSFFKLEDKLVLRGESIDTILHRIQSYYRRKKGMPAQQVFKSKERLQLREKLCR